MPITTYRITRNKKNVGPIFALIYFMIGLIIAYADTKALIIYFTILPIQYYFFSCSLKSGNIFLIIFMFLMFLTQGIDPIFFFLDSDKASEVGFSAIGTFDFTLSSYFSSYSCIFVFCLTLLFIVKKRTTYKKDNVIPYVVDRIKSFAGRYSTKPSYLLYLIAFTILMSILSLWMYNNQIGMIGLNQKPLPYHLSGLLFYFRRYIASLIVLYLYLRCNSKSIALIVVILYTFVIGITGSSKTMGTLIFIPIALFSIIEKDYLKCAISIIIYAIYFELVVLSRRIIFIYDFIAYSISDVFSYVIDEFSFESDLFLSVFSTFTGRLFGAQVLVLMDQQNAATINDLVQYYLTGKTNLDITAMFGISFDADKDYAFGVAIGYTGYMVLLSCRNFLITMLQALILSELFLFANKCIQTIVNSRSKNVIIIAALLVLSYSFISFWEGSIMTFYVSVGIIFIIKKILCIGRKKPLNESSYLNYS